MSHRYLYGFVWILCLSSSVFAAVTTDVPSVGVQRPGKEVVSEITFRNDANAPVSIMKHHSSFNRIDVKDLPVTIEPHASLRVPVSVHVDRQLGAQSYTVDFDLDSDQKTIRASIGIFVDSAISGEPKEVDFGVISSGKSIEQRVVLESQDFPELRAISGTDADKLVSTEIASGGKAVILRPSSKAGWGIHEGWVNVTTNSLQQPSAWIKYRFEQRGRIVPEAYAINAGVQHADSIATQTLFIRDVEGAAFQIGKVSQQGSAVNIRQDECPVKSPSCKALEISIEKQIAGKISTIISLDLPQYKQTLTIEYSGLLLPADAKIGEINSETQKRAEAAQHQDIASVLKSVTSAKPVPLSMPTPPGKGPLLKWSVQNELQIYGYIIYRSNAENGPMQRINAELILSQSKQNEQSVEYRWRDTTAEPGHTYWYQIGTIDPHGIRNNLTGALKKTYVVEPAK